MLYKVFCKLYYAMDTLFWGNFGENKNEENSFDYGWMETFFFLRMA